MKIKWEIQEAGWLNLIMELNRTYYFYNYSWTYDILGEISNILVNLIPLYEDSFNKKFCFLADSEPVIDLWEFKRKKDILFIDITSFKEINLDNMVMQKNLFENYDINKSLFKTHILEEQKIQVEFDLFVKEMVFSFDLLLRKYGIVGYRENMVNFEFPLSFYLILKNYILTKRKFDLKEIPAGEEQLSPALASDLQSEINLILKK